MFKCSYLSKKLRKLYLDYKWFYMVAMNGEEGDRRFREYYGNNTQD